LLFYVPPFGEQRRWTVVGAALVAVGGLGQMYVTIIGGQAYPLEMFPGMEMQSSFFDGAVAHYAPSPPEVALGVSGIAIALLLTLLAIKVLPFVPKSLADEHVEPHTAGEPAAGAQPAAA
jgi:molybdopterin-containing oxidoreductase family membrane subunit